MIKHFKTILGEPRVDPNWILIWSMQGSFIYRKKHVLLETFQSNFDLLLDWSIKNRFKKSFSFKRYNIW